MKKIHINPIVILFVALLVGACTAENNADSTLIRINPDEISKVPKEGADWIETIQFMPIQPGDG